MAVPGDRVQLLLCEITADQAEERILRYLRDRPGQLVKEWAMLNVISDASHWEDNRLERQFYMRQITRLAHEQKIVRYRKIPNRGCIRISEAYVAS